MTRDHAQWIDVALDGISEGDKKRLIDLLSRVRRTFDDNVRLLD